MSLIGCNFTCRNKECKFLDTGFTITGSWPLGKIDDVIENTDDDELRDQLIKKKEAGYEYSKITYPDPYITEIATYAVEKYCPKCTRIQTFEKGNEQDICQVCGEEYLDFEQSTTDGLPCPSCGEKLEQVRWYVQVEEEESEESSD